MRATLETLGMILVVGIPVALVLLWMRRPVGGVPRDAMASRAKASASGLPLLTWPSRAYRETLIDDATDTRSSVQHKRPEGQ